MKLEFNKKDDGQTVTMHPEIGCFTVTQYFLSIHPLWGTEIQTSQNHHYNMMGEEVILSESSDGKLYVC